MSDRIVSMPSTDGYRKNWNVVFANDREVDKSGICKRLNELQRVVDGIMADLNNEKTKLHLDECVEILNEIRKLYSEL